jgi:hypothetical protein
MSLGDVLGSSGPCPEITVKGKTWKIGHPTQKAKAELENLAVRAAVSEVRSLKEVLPADAYKEAFAELTASISARDFRTWGTGWQRIVWGPQSVHLFLLSLLREHQSQATESDAIELATSAPEELAAALAQVVPSFVLLLLNDRKDITHQQRDEILRVVQERISQQPQPLTNPST